MKIRSSSSFLSLQKHQPKKASKQCTFTFLLPPDTLTPLSHPHHELYIICANGKSPILTWNVGASCLASAEPLTGPALFLCNFATTKCWALFKDGVRGNKDRENKRGAKNEISVRKLLKPGEDQRRLENFLQRQPLRRGTRGTTKNMRQKKTNTEGIWKKPHVALL